MEIVVGTKVRATRRIVEGDEDPDLEAKSCKPGWLHAEEGALGEVVHIEDHYLSWEDDSFREEEGPAVTVRFEDSGSATLVFPDEIEVV